MLQQPKWQYDEMKQAGIDYTDMLKVQEYDSKIRKLRDMKKESAAILSALGISEGQSILEFGTGTGEFAIAAAKKFAAVYAVDVSPAMLEYARKKAQSENLKNIGFYHGGFLTYEHSGKPPDAVVSQFALHHLPDFWKLVALKRIYGMLKEGGIFYLRDTVYSFDASQYKKFFDGAIEKIMNAGGEEAAKDIEMSIRAEYATLDWIMEKLLVQAGFAIEKAEYRDYFLACYICRKPEKNYSDKNAAADVKVGRQKLD